MSPDSQCAATQEIPEEPVAELTLPIANALLVPAKTYQTKVTCEAVRLDGPVRLSKVFPGAGLLTAAKTGDYLVKMDDTIYVIAKDAFESVWKLGRPRRTRKQLTGEA